MSTMIDHVKALIARASNDAERDAAQRALARLEASQAVKGPRGPKWIDTARYGSRRTGHMGSEALYAAIKADLAMAVKIAKSPKVAGEVVSAADELVSAMAAVRAAGGRVSLSRKWEGTTPTIAVKVIGADAGWLWEEGRFEHHHYAMTHVYRYRLSAAALRVVEVLEAFLASWGRDNSDVMSDYFDRDFYSRIAVGTPKGSGYWDVDSRFGGLKDMIDYANV